MSGSRALALLFLVGCTTAAPKTGAPDGTVAGDGSAGDSAGPLEDEDSGGGTAPTAGFGGCGERVHFSTLDAAACVTAAACTWAGDQPYAYLGHEVWAGEDIDGDAVPDIAISATLHDGPAGADAGQVLLLSGAAVTAGEVGPGGLGVVAVVDGATPGASLGSALASAGDTDGDGVFELAIGARGHDPGGLPGAGAVLLVSGTTGTVASPATETPATRISGTQPWSRVGSSLAGGADVDGDGLDEVVLSSALRDPELGDDLQGPGRASLFLGQAAGHGAELTIADADHAWAGSGTDMAGHALAMGDLDGDGYAELAIGAPYAVGLRGRVVVVAGGPVLTSGTLSEPEAFLDGSAAGDVFGWTLAVADLTGDGHPELIVGAPLADTDELSTSGEVTVYDGSGGIHLGMAPLATVRGHWDDQQLGTGLSVGRPVAGAAPVLAMGAVDAMHGLQTHAGRLFLASGDALTGEHSAGTLPIQLHGAASKDYLGRTSAFADLDGDGQDELLLGSAYVNTDTATDAGSLWLFWGG